MRRWTTRRTHCGRVIAWRDCFDADDLFILTGLDLHLGAVDFVIDRVADDEVGGVHGFVGVGATGVLLAQGDEGKIVGQVLVLFICGPVGLEVFQV